jgi:hypothetical protein
VYVKVTVVEPPQMGGAPVLLFVITPKQPPVAVAEFSHVVNAEFNAACVWQAPVVVFTAQFIVTGGGAVVYTTLSKSKD